VEWRRNMDVSPVDVVTWTFAQSVSPPGARRFDVP
jgi:hypothetical protein